jgi:hypothetical protein
LSLGGDERWLYDTDTDTDRAVAAALRQPPGPGFGGAFIDALVHGQRQALFPGLPLAAVAVGCTGGAR